ncbi:sigma-70 family RNA polymerase sigma factor [Phreatobacter cathodiphilus]|jgi:RNA polymerase sigma-70 factor (ECF subfamily)|uniref:RNA polymerase subunit sigma n=1 Tax=Phreatobacter cathodiphilus TaxID=1868589 RepID=A0A2S0N6M3_9HYPH|nr:sigma-70 family RNA polymerase sigma factor [Phreatobacter cathodiphilus]AVO43812.1 RNA polymerase subunit sigma [Phreatobacter cathodiphilus]
MQSDSDQDLILRVAKGDRLAFRALYARHNVRVFRFILRFIKDEGQAEDLIGEVFLDVWRQADRFEGRSSVSTWILGMARFKALSSLRKTTEAELDEEQAAAIADDADTPETVSQKLDKAKAIRRCIDQLSPEHREIVDLVYYQEKSISEVAEIVGIPENTVKTRMFYARKRLQELMQSAGVDRGWP